MSGGAVYFGAPERALFGWLHLPPEGVAARDRAVVVCAPFGYEYTHSHRTLRALARSLAQAGIPTLRFDYHGVGDSPGGDLEPGRVARWREDIAQAVEFARQATGASRVCLAGLRLGAALAADAAPALGDAISELVLWSPVVSGKRYVRELRAVAAAAAAGGDTEGVIDAGGFLMTAETAESLQALDLKTRGGFAGKVLVLHREDMEADRALAESWRRRGAQVDELGFAGYAAMMAEPHYTELPHDALRAITEWCAAAAPEGAPASRSGGGSSVRIEHRDAGGKTGLVTERACELGGGLFGILCAPAAGASPERPPILWINAGSVHRVGPSRLYVSLTRALALDGCASLRLDLQGLGDSPAVDHRRDNHPYPDTAVEDARRALAWLARETGARRFVVAGLCSGAHAAFRAALEVDGLELADTVLINPLTYRWQDGMPFTLPRTTQFQQASYYKRGLKDPRKWLKALQGRVQFRAAAEVFARQALRRAGRVVQSVRPTQLASDVAGIGARGRRLTLFIAEGDPGYDLLVADAARQVRRARREGRFAVTFIPKADHTFSSHGPRGELIARVREHVAGGGGR